MNISNLNTYKSTLQSQQNKLNKSKENIEKTREQKELLKACQQFESIFTNILMKEMRETVGDSSLTKKSRGREIFQSMYDEKLSDAISSGDNGIGIAKMLYNQMKNNI